MLWRSVGSLEYLVCEQTHCFVIPVIASNYNHALNMSYISELNYNKCIF